ncbi:MAG: sugar transferase [Acidimicrobiales bacterium]
MVVPADIRPPWRVVFGALVLGVLCVCLGAQGAYFAESAKTEVWQAVGEIEARNPDIYPETVAVSLQSPSLWKSVSFVEGISDETFQKWYSVEVVGGTQIIRVKYADPDQERATRIVDTVIDNYFARYPLPDAVDQISVIEERISELREQEVRLGQLLADRADLTRDVQVDYQNELLSNQRQQTSLSLQLNEIAQRSQRRVDTQARRLSPSAFVLDEPIEPTPLKAAVFGAGVGGLVGIVAIYLTLHRTAMPQSPAIDIYDPSGDRKAALRRYPPVGTWVGRFFKRLVDIVVAGVLLLITLPLLILIALGVRLTSRGGAFFRQERVGLHGETFEILKFRTMTVNNDDSEHRAYIQSMLESETGEGDGVHKLNDSRVTGIGGVLRRFSLDELPQLWNVLKGDMSLTGPRPALPWEHEMFSPYHQQRVRAVPGCSGLWQTSGRNMLTMNQMLDLDINYIERWSFFRDLGILLKTPFAIIRGDGAR